MEFHNPSRLPRGFRTASRNCGLKPAAKDLAVFVSEVDAAAAAVFTRNHFPGAPVVLGRETIRGGRLRAIAVNSKVSNVATGERGVADARRMAQAAASALGTSPDLVLVSSTGVIGVPLPIEKIERGLAGIASELVDDPLVGAEGIMTTDTHPADVAVFGASFRPEEPQGLSSNGIEIRPDRGQHLCRDSLPLSQKAEEEVLRANVAVIEVASFAHCELEHFLRS